MKKQRKHYTPDEKVAILRRHLVAGVPISELCDGLVKSYVEHYNNVRLNSAIATSRRRTCSPGISRRFRPSETGSWRRQENSGGIDATGPRDADNLLFADDSDKWLRSGSTKD
jgi:hypothetical protein